MSWSMSPPWPRTAEPKAKGSHFSLVGASVSLRRRAQRERAGGQCSSGQAGGPPECLL